MDSKTNKALLFLMIGEILSIVSAIVMFAMFFQSSFEDLITKSTTDTLIASIPSAAIGGIGALFLLIGAILFLLGRKEFGEKHQKYVFYAVIIFIVSIVVTIAIFMVSAVVAFLPQMQNLGESADTSQIIDALINSNFISIIAMLGPISAFFGGLIWIFAFFNLENKTGKTVLYAALACMVVTSIAVGITSVSIFNDFISSDTFEGLIESNSDATNAYTQILSNYQWIGMSGVVNVIGTVASNILLFFAIYIPYQRIKSGELKPMIITQTTSKAADRICPNCGKAIPFDANNCPYCGKIFDNYL